MTTSATVHFQLQSTTGVADTAIPSSSSIIQGGQANRSPSPRADTLIQKICVFLRAGVVETYTPAGQLQRVCGPVGREGVGEIVQGEGGVEVVGSD